MPIIECVKIHYSHAVVRRCSEQGCELGVGDLENHVILKGEKLSEGRVEICDCIIFLVSDYVTVGIVELKSGAAHAREIKKKLENGSKIAVQILKKCKAINTRLEFFHIALCRGWRSSERLIIRKSKIELKGKKYPIIPKSCGTSFSDIIRALR